MSKIDWGFTPLQKGPRFRDGWDSSREGLGASDNFFWAPNEVDP